MIQLLLQLLHSICNRCFTEHTLHILPSGDLTFLSSPFVKYRQKIQIGI